MFVFLLGGIITDFYPESQTISVYYSDYGTIAIVPRHHVKLLEPKFAEFEAQAILCKLSGVAPTTYDGSWPQEAGTYVLKMVQECHGFLVAQIVDVKIHDGERTLYELEILLYDTLTNNHSEGLIVTENLIESKLASRVVANNDIHEDNEVFDRYTAIAAIFAFQF